MQDRTLLHEGRPSRRDQVPLATWLVRRGERSPPRAGSVAGWFAPVRPEARVAVLRSVLYVFVLLDMHLIVRDPIPLSHHPDLYRPLLLARVLHLPPPSLPLAWTLYAVLVVGCLVGAAGRAPRLAGWVVAAAFTWWVAIGFSYGKVDHDHLALVVALWVLPTVGAGAGRLVLDAVARPRPAGRSSASRSPSSATYFLSALVKIRNGGVEPDRAGRRATSCCGRSCGARTVSGSS